MWCGWVQGNSDGSLVPMVQLVTLENVIAMVLLVPKKKQRLLVIMFTLEFVCFIVQSISIASI